MLTKLPDCLKLHKRKYSFVYYVDTPMFVVDDYIDKEGEKREFTFMLQSANSGKFHKKFLYPEEVIESTL